MLDKTEIAPLKTILGEMVPLSLYETIEESAKGWHKMYDSMFQEKEDWFNKCMKLMETERELKCRVISMEYEIEALKKNVHTCKIVSMNIAK